MSKVLDQLRSRWGEYMPQVVLQTCQLIITIFITINLIVIMMMGDVITVMMMIRRQVFVLTNGRPLICLHCTETYIMCGEEKTGRLIVYNRYLIMIMVMMVMMRRRRRRRPAGWSSITGW